MDPSASPVPLRRRLLLRFAGIVVPLLCLFLVFAFGVLVWRQQRVLREEARGRALSVVRNLAMNGASAREIRADYLLEPLAIAAAGLQDVTLVVFTNEAGRALAQAEASGSTTRFEDLESLARVALATGQQEERRVEAAPDRPPCLLVAVPMTRRSGRVGAVAISLSLQRPQAALKDSLRELLLLAALLLGGAGLVTLPIVWWLVSPLREVAATAQELAQGNLAARVRRLPQNELGRVGTALNGVAERLAEIVERERAERSRLEARVAEMRSLAEQAGGGRLEVRAPEGDDEMGRLADGFNKMTATLQSLLERERRLRTDLEANRSTLQGANARLLEQDRLKSDFLNTVSHELRTPLTSIKAFSEILLDGPPALDARTRREQVEFLDIINQEAERLTRLIEDLLDLSRIEEGQVTWKMLRLPVDVVIEGCVRSCRALSDQKDVVLEGTCPRDLVVRGDRDRLLQVATNLVSNAIKFTPAGGQVRVWGEASGNGVAIVVRDTGVGIPRDQQALIFEKFRQVESQDAVEFATPVVRRPQAGSGLGLPIVKSIVEAHDGRIDVTSEPGQGSTFRVWLPSVAPVEPSPPTAPPSSGADEKAD